MSGKRPGAITQGNSEFLQANQPPPLGLPPPSRIIFFSLSVDLVNPIFSLVRLYPVLSFQVAVALKWISPEQIRRCVLRKRHKGAISIGFPQSHVVQSFVCTGGRTQRGGGG
jgi:hypothetical protein